MTTMPYRIHIRHGEFELDVEGDRGFVESYIEAFLAEGGIPEVRAGKRPRAGKPEEEKAVPRKRPIPEVDKAALKSFMAGKEPRSNKERYLYYIQFWREEGVNEVSDAHIHACFIADGLSIPPTGRQHFSTLRNEGVLTAGSTRGLWKLKVPAEKVDQSPARKAAAGGKAVAKPRASAVEAAVTKRPKRRGPARRKTPKSVAEVMGTEEP
ncbi:MAG: hypothetical protein ACP5VF_00495 [Acidobacteriota bacterium]